MKPDITKIKRDISEALRERVRKSNSTVLMGIYNSLLSEFMGTTEMLTKKNRAIIKNIYKHLEVNEIDFIKFMTFVVKDWDTIRKEFFTANSVVIPELGFIYKHISSLIALYKKHNIEDKPQDKVKKVELDNV